MIDLAVSCLQERIKTLAFLDLVGGIARPQKIRVGDVEKTLPATPDADNPNGYLWLTPDSGKSGIAYFELLNNYKKEAVGAGRGFAFEALVRCVVWLNTKRLSPAGAVPAAMASVVSVLQGRYDTQLPILNLQVFPDQEAARGPELFAKYTYDEAETQFLMLPFEYFAFDFTVSFVLAANCPTVNIVKTDPTC